MFRNFIYILPLFLVGNLSIFFAQDGSPIVQDTILTEDQGYESPERIFYSTRIINGHSVETISKGYMEMRIEHRFGDIAGTNGGYQNMFGFDNLSDMRIGLEYGISNKLMAGLGRCKGTGAPYRSLLDGFLKYKVMTQDEKHPISMAVVGGSTFTYMKASTDESQVNHFPKAVHRLAYFAQINVAKRFGERLAVALMPTFVHRNYVASNDMNALFALGGAFRFKLNHKFAIIGEYYQAFHGENLRPTNVYQPSMAVALEWQTFGHNFTLNITNSGGLGETQFIPYTYEKLSLGQFRFGFCIGRKFIINE